MNKIEPLKDKELIYRNKIIQSLKDLPKNWERPDYILLGFNKRYNSFYQKEDIKLTLQWLESQIDSITTAEGFRIKMREAFPDIYERRNENINLSVMR